MTEIARDDGNVARLDPAQQPFETLDVHRFMQAIMNGLIDERVVRDFARAGKVLRARDLVGEDRAHQILGAHPLQRRGDLLAGAKAR